MLIETLLGALAEAVFTLVIDDLAQRPGLIGLREKLRGLSQEKLAFQHALTTTYIAFSQCYSSLAASFFDEQFLETAAVVSEFAKLLTPNQTPDIAHLVGAWQVQFNQKPQIDLSEPMLFFVENLENEIKKQSLLKPFVDSRAFEQLYLITQRSQEQIAIQGQMRDLLLDIRKLLHGFANPLPSLTEDKNDHLFMKQSNFGNKLIDFLLKAPAFQNRANRDVLLLGLDAIRNSIERSNVPATDLASIIISTEAVGQFQTGDWPLIILMHNARPYCPTATELGRQLDKLLLEYVTLKSMV